MTERVLVMVTSTCSNRVASQDEYRTNELSSRNDWLVSSALGDYYARRLTVRCAQYSRRVFRYSRKLGETQHENFVKPFKEYWMEKIIIGSCFSFWSSTMNYCSSRLIEVLQVFWYRLLILILFWHSTWLSLIGVVKMTTAWWTSKHSLDS